MLWMSVHMLRVSLRCIVKRRVAGKHFMFTIIEAS